MSAVESHVLLWELLSSLKNLTHLNIDLCMVKLYDGCDDASKQKLINTFKDCRSLQSIQICARIWENVHSSHPICSFKDS